MTYILPTVMSSGVISDCVWWVGVVGYGGIKAIPIYICIDATAFPSKWPFIFFRSSMQSRVYTLVQFPWCFRQIKYGYDKCTKSNIKHGWQWSRDPPTGDHARDYECWRRLVLHAYDYANTYRRTRCCVVTFIFKLSNKLTTAGFLSSLNVRRGGGPRFTRHGRHVRIRHSK